VLRAWEKVRPGLLERVGRLAEIQRDEEDFWRRRGKGLVLRRKKGVPALDLRVFLSYHKAEQRRALRRHFGLSHFTALERARAFAGSPAPRVSVPGGWIEKDARTLVFRPLEQKNRSRVKKGH
jgi:hypothetical protein